MSFDRFCLSNYVLFALFFWGLFGAFLASFYSVLLMLIVSAPFLYKVLFNTGDACGDVRVDWKGSSRVYYFMLLFLLFYLVLDSLYGRQKFDFNMFVGANAESFFIDVVNEQVGEKRGFMSLLGQVMMFYPFFVIDLMRRTKMNILARIISCIIIGLFLFYEIGISRAYLMVMIASLYLGHYKKISLGKIIYLSVLLLFLVMLASVLRGSVYEYDDYTTIVRGFAFPAYNLSCLLAVDPSGGDSFMFILEFFKKFVPGFMFSLQVYSFNIEMTKYIYGFMGEYVDSVSVFTYLGELFYYKPSLLTALIAGVILFFLIYLLEKYIPAEFSVSRIYIGLMSFVLLRSRIMDLYSFYLFALISIVFVKSFYAILRGFLHECVAAEKKRDHHCEQV